MTDGKDALFTMIIIVGVVLFAIATIVIAGPNNLAQAMRIPYISSGNQQIDMVLGAIMLTLPGGNIIMITAPSSAAVATSVLASFTGFTANFVIGLSAVTFLPGFGPAILFMTIITAVKSLTFMQGVLIIGLGLIAMGFLGLDYNSKQKSMASPR